MNDSHDTHFLGFIVLPFDNALCITEATLSDGRFAAMTTVAPFTSMV